MAIHHLLLKSDKEKGLFIARLSKEGKEILVRCEEPASEYPELAGKVRDAGPREYLVSPPYTYELLEHWLSFGDWIAVYPAKAGFSPGNTFKRTLRSVEQKMVESGIEVLIDSFHDNIEWNVFVQL